MSDATREAATRVLRPLIVRILRAPAFLYDCGLGWVFGRRFLRLTHRGRRSGRLYQTMLEVLGESPVDRELFVMVGLGPRAQWYRNVTAGGAVEIAIGRDRFHPTYRELPTPEGADVLAGYERRNRRLTPDRPGDAQPAHGLAVRRQPQCARAPRHRASDPCVPARILTPSTMRVRRPRRAPSD